MTATMVVNGVEYGPVSSPGGLQQLNIQGMISIGGLEDYTILSPLARSNISGFSGCIEESAEVRKFTFKLLIFLLISSI